ncbi:hypothetical protein SBA4_960026 [Candidatus Sulfopaludibacter sp. SbA4]|nr:hypothetical protein SBA4_960026 [Candidatus Sulfopaludibacter sp. SbA4]
MWTGEPRLALQVGFFRYRSFRNFVEVVHRKTEVGQDVFHGHATILLERCDGGADGCGIFRCERLIVDMSQRQFAIERREHALQQAANGGQLIGGERREHALQQAANGGQLIGGQTVEKRVGVVPLLCEIGFHDFL